MPLPTESPPVCGVQSGWSPGFWQRQLCECLLALCLSQQQMWSHQGLSGFPPRWLQAEWKMWPLSALFTG